MIKFNKIKLKGFKSFVEPTEIVIEHGLTGIVGPNAGDLIGETIIAIEMGASVEDIALSIHPHPTLTETIGNAAEMFSGTITDLYVAK